jgi:arylsulfatase A-like enzyme
VVLVATGLAGWHVVSERRALAALPPAPSGAKNVLLIIWDTVRSSSLGLYGYARPTTPSLERLAAHGVTFDMALSTAPWTLTSHASMFTGRFPYELSADILTPLNTEYSTVAEKLSAGGFVTAGFVANSYYCDVDNGLARGFLHYEDFVVSPGEILIASSFGRAVTSSPRVRKLVGYYDVVARRSADDISGSFLHWLDGRPNRPFFAFLNYYDAHLPYLPPEPWRSRFGPHGSLELWRLDHSHTRTAELLGRGGMTRAQKQELLDSYEGGIAYLDNRLGLLLDSLDKRGLLKNTVVIVASDHGEHQGEHSGVYGHNRTLYTQETRVPLVISVPGEDSLARRVKTPVTLRDIAATVLDLSAMGSNASLPGTSLSRYWRAPQSGAATKPDTVMSQYAQLNLVAIADGRYHLVRGPRKGIHLFDLVADPDEAHDLAETPEGAPIVASMTASYRAALEAKPKHPADRAGP